MRKYRERRTKSLRALSFTNLASLDTYSTKTCLELLVLLGFTFFSPSFCTIWELKHHQETHQLKQKTANFGFMEKKKNQKSLTYLGESSCGLVSVSWDFPRKHKVEEDLRQVETKVTGFVQERPCNSSAEEPFLGEKASKTLWDLEALTLFAKMGLLGTTLLTLRAIGITNLITPL